MEKLRHIHHCGCTVRLQNATTAGSAGVSPAAACRPQPPAAFAAALTTQHCSDELGRRTVLNGPEQQYSEMLGLHGFNKTTQLHLLFLVLQCTCGMIVLLVKFTLLLHLVYSCLPFICWIKIIIYYRPVLAIRTECRPTVLFIVLSITVKYMDVVADNTLKMDARDCWHAYEARQCGETAFHHKTYVP